MHDTNWERQYWQQQFNRLRAAHEFRQRIEVLDEELSDAFRHWQHWVQRIEWFESRPHWQRWLMGGMLTHKILVFFEQSAEGEYWSIEIQYH